MILRDDLDTFLTSVIVRKALQFDDIGIPHTHNRADPDAILPPFKFHLCTPYQRPEGQLSEDEMDTVAAFIGRDILKLDAEQRPKAIVGVPNVGTNIAHRVQLHLRSQGVYVHRLRLGKQPNGAMYLIDSCHAGKHVCLVDDLVHRSLSKQRAIEALGRSGLIVTELRVFLDYGQGGKESLETLGVTTHTVSTVRQVLALGKDDGSISQRNYENSMGYLEATRVESAA